MIRISRDHVICSFSRRHPPVATVEPGTEICFETWDTRTGSIQSEQDSLVLPSPNGPNPATGPIFVRGAEPGDSLVVEILDIRVAERAFTGVKPDRGVLKHMIQRARTKMVDIRNGEAVFTEQIRFAIRPMIGTIGTAPADRDVGNLHPGPHGGNMDHNDVRVGGRVHLPVFVPGGLLALGDVHASMGDGEISIIALEVCGEVCVRVDLLQAENIQRPWIEFPEAWITTGDGPTLDDAIRVAGEDMARLLQRRLGLSVEDAYMLISIRGDVRISQCAEPSVVATTARIVMPVL